ncbi:F-box/kelch-repeat protein At3g06240-like [Bidens hawaiensis]|uniref:F-box/kelch-repeat protein At3g06240-like n=1 Tax=Bidens hawaiensis TaxID=980011 RepID=UPI00404B265B
MAAELPSENIYNILSRLPVKSLARFQCVSKLWCSYINNPYLETLHAKRAVMNDDPMLISFHNLSSKLPKDSRSINYDQFTIRFLEYKEAPRDAGIFTLEVGKKTPVIKLMCKKEFFHGYVILCSCNGLLYSTRTIRGDSNLAVINPLTKECCELPPIYSTKSSRKDSIELGFDDSTNTFKMVFIARKLRAMVHVLGTDSWRKIPQVPASYITGEGVFAKGSEHWLSEDYRKVSIGKQVISFDMAKEEFGLINSLDQIYSGMISKEQLVDLHGELGYVYQISDHMVEVWVLKEAGWVMHCLFEKKPPLFRDIVKVLGFWNERKDVLMTVDGWHMFVYNLYDDSLHEVSSVGLEEGHNHIDIRMYRSSLFSTRYSLF